jgi:hypothetical protein
MGHNATWKVLEQLMLDLKKKGAAIPPNIINDLRSAKLMIKISESGSIEGESAPKVDEFLGNVESKLLAEAQKTFGEEYVDQWLRRLDAANVQCEVCEEKSEDNKFITAVPRDQKWVRVEPNGKLTSERLKLIANQTKLSVNPQKDGRLVVFGQQEDVKEFLKKMTAEVAKK